MYISPTKTAKDWHTTGLTASSGKAKWKKVIKEFFHKRLDERYMKPIKCIRKHGSRRGEGFSIVTLQCALIEFLESTMQGKIYCHKDADSNNFEYSKSGEMFRAFLTTRDPFKNEFNGHENDFYVSVRCGLLHEAQTKNGWMIRAKSNMILDADKKVLYRDNFQEALQCLIEKYESDLLANVGGFREAFIRKFNHLAGPCPKMKDVG